MLAAAARIGTDVRDGAAKANVVPHKVISAGRCPKIFDIGLLDLEVT